MVWVLASSVHTSGVNWESVGVILAGVGVIFGMITWLTNRRETKQEDRDKKLREDFTSSIDNMRHDMKESIDNLAEVMNARLETKATVAEVSERVARLETRAEVQK